MARTKTPHKAKKLQGQAEMVQSGAGDWIVLPTGHFYDQRRGQYVKLCHGCNRAFYAKRTDAKTCSPACRKKISRRTLKQNLLPAESGLIL
jgi:hypothetical protein